MKPDRIEQCIRTLRIRSRPDGRKERLDSILGAYDRCRQSRTASGRWVAKVAIAASIAIIVTILALMHRSPNRGIASSAAEITTAGSLQRAFRQGGMDGVEHQLDRAFELFGPWPMVLPEQGLL